MRSCRIFANWFAVRITALPFSFYFSSALRSIISLLAAVAWPNNCRNTIFIWMGSTMLVGKNWGLTFFSESFQLRGEFYGFVPIFPIKKDEYGQAYYGKAFTKCEYLGEISLVFQLSFGSISAYVNHYSSPSNDWNVGSPIPIDFHWFAAMEPICFGWLPAVDGL